MTGTGMTGLVAEETSGWPLRPLWSR